MAQRGSYMIEEPYRSHSAVTLDATITPPADAIWTNLAGDVNVTLEDGVSRTYTLTASSGLNLGVVKVNTSGTTIAAASLTTMRR